MRLRLAIAFVCSCVVALGIAGAASASVPGGFAQLPGAAGCVSSGGAGGCTAGRGFGTEVRVAISPDGRNAYNTTFAASDSWSLIAELKSSERSLPVGFAGSSIVMLSMLSRSSVQK